MTKTSCFLRMTLSLVLLVFGIDIQATAQPIGEPATWHWQASTDGTLSWRSGEVRALVGTSIPIRAVCEFPAELRRFFGDVSLDVMIASARAGDRADSVQFARRVIAPARTDTRRYGDVLKIDLPGDNHPPGVGSEWLRIYQYGPPAAIYFNYDNPLIVMQFLLHVDGNPGTRVVSGAFLQNTRSPTGIAVLTLNDYPGIPHPSSRLHPLTQFPLTIRVEYPCGGADLDDGSGTGTRDGGVTIDDLLYFLKRYENSDLQADLDNGTFTGTPDGGVTVDDLLYFLHRFEAGC